MAGEDDNNVEDLAEDLARFEQSDAERNALLSRLIENLKRARRDVGVLSDDLERERDACRKLQGENREYQNLKSRRGYVAVLIDADADDYMFRADFLNKHKGGEAAADELLERVRDYVKTLALENPDVDVVVRAFANLKGLKVGCVKHGKMRQDSNMNQFAQGLSQRNGLFDFVDVGEGKEEADHKIRQNISFFLNDVRCKHLILGVCHDGGYKPELNQIASDYSKRGLVTLLASGTVNKGIKKLGFPRAPLRLETVFSPGRGEQQRDLTPPAGSSKAIDGRSDATQPFDNPGALVDRLKPCFDENGDKIDKALKFDEGLVNAMRTNKLCGYYYLRGHCDGTCNKNHVPPPLSPKEFDCLWYATRGGQCFRVRKGKKCEDAMCIYGHWKT